MTHPARTRDFSSWKPADRRRIRSVLLQGFEIGRIELGPDPVRSLCAWGRSRLREGRNTPLARQFAMADRVSRWELGDMLYLLARSCLAADTDYAYAASARFFEDPAPVEVLAADVRRIAARTRLDVSGPPALPDATPPPGTAAQAARHCVELAERLRGVTLAELYMRSSIAIYEGDFDRVLDVSETAVHGPDPAGWLRNVEGRRMAACLRSGRIEECIEIGRGAMDRYPGDRLLLVNLAQAHAAAGDLVAVQTVAGFFVSSNEPIPDRSWWNTFLRSEAKAMAIRLQRDAEEIEALFLTTNRAQP